MIKVEQFSLKEKIKDGFSLPADFEVKPNITFISQAVRVYKDTYHPGTSQVKTRSRVNKSTRKIYRQKGTGGARHGAKSAPIFVGGGIAHGPKGIKRHLTLSKKQKSAALKHALSLKAINRSLVVLDGLENVKKTKEVQKSLDIIKNAKNLSKKDKKITFAVSDKNIAKKAFIRNIHNIAVENYKDLNADIVFSGGLIVIDKEVFSGKQNEKSQKTVTTEIKKIKKYSKTSVKPKKQKAIKKIVEKKTKVVKKGKKI